MAQQQKLVESTRSHQMVWRWQQIFAVIVVVQLALPTLACAFLAGSSHSASNKVTVRKRLPTLTATFSPAQSLALAPSEATSAKFQPSPVSAESGIPLAAPPELPIFTPTLVYSAAPGEVVIATNQIDGTPPQNPGAAPRPVMTNIPTATPSETPVPSSTPTATALPPTETPTVTPLPTATPLPQGWVFRGVRMFYDQDEGGLRLLGDVLNNTGVTQQVDHITGTFYDAQGQALASPEITDYWPLDAVPQGGQMPFDLILAGVDSAARFDLRVEAQPGGDVLQQDFQFLEINPSQDAEDYCVRGKLQNPGRPLQYFLVIVAVLFDDQGNVINFSDYYELSPTSVVGNKFMDFENCINSFDQNVARYELRAWGL